MATIPVRGGKHICASCATRFFDLNKQPAVCPKCNQKVAAVKAAVRRTRRSRVPDADASKAPQEQVVAVANPTLKRVKWK
jgi:uncharacterized protein (TIGR02300 family)